MIKKAILLAVLVAGALWGAGYDLDGLHDEIVTTADDNAGNMSGRNFIQD